MFQDFNLLDTLTLEENIALAMVVSGTAENSVGTSEDMIESQVRNLAEKLGIADILNKFPYEVSGGQRQRCACTRALINVPSIILADEPTGALDSKSASSLLNSFRTMNVEMDATILMVTHDIFSASYCSRICMRNMPSSPKMKQEYCFS